MTRGISIRSLLVAVALATGLLVVFITLHAVDDALRAVAPALERTQRTVILESAHSTQFVRGLIGIAVAAVAAAWLGAAVARMLRAARTTAPGGALPRRLWLDEAQAIAESRGYAAEDALARQRALERRVGDLDRLLESVSEGILQLDGDGRVVRANRAARRLLGMPSDAEGKPVGTVVRSAELRALLQRATVEESLPPREVAIEDATLVVTARRLGAGPDASAAGPAVAGLAVAIADLTPIRRLENVRRDFVANASHELKTPLTSIRGYAETLRDESLPAETRAQFIATISKNAERLQHIVDDLLDLSRLESGSWRPSLTDVDVRETANAAWADFDDRARQRGLQFVGEFETGSRAAADPSALRQILSNLYDNAIRHTGPGGRISVRVRDWEPPADLPLRDRRRAFLAIEVGDTGSGIPMDALPRIFERFYRVDPARSRAEGGTGLGLAIVKHLAESMGGTAEAESQLGAGTTVRVVLPAAEGGAGATLTR